MTFPTARLFLALAWGVAASTDPEWEQFKAMYKKTYVSEVDEQQRYELFKASQVRVAELNALNGHVAFGINEKADRFSEEKQQNGLMKTKSKGLADSEETVFTAPVVNFTRSRRPPTINWRRTRAVTPIKNQGQCGSCYAFSATQAIESQMILATGGKVAMTLSPQQIASCAPMGGCTGGNVPEAYEYVMSAPGLANSFYIPYEQSMTNSSQVTLSCPSAKVQQMEQLAHWTGGFAKVTGYSYAVPPCFEGACQSQDLQALAAALERTPVSISVNDNVWSDYVGGVVTAKACGSMGAGDMNHAVMVTGFNTTAEMPYWIVRNSWGSVWGDSGYIYLEMANNTCGLANEATIPQVKMGLSEKELAEAAVWREAMYQLATYAPAI